MQVVGYNIFMNVWINDILMEMVIINKYYRIKT